LFSACQRKAPPTRPAPPPPATIIPASPAAYVATAASIDLFVVRASQLALERSSDAGTRALATALLAEHRGLASQLSFAGRRLNILPRARMQEREEQRLAWLMTQTPFDTSYVRQMLGSHEQSLKLHGDFVARGGSPTLRPVAASAMRVERNHIDRLRGV
ncbi:MAG: DUF4142 domain-containing protein, partial [Pseudomonadota bacterium]|nr:DUF4142 domain-containing protein [Pseudomonadota bacterium]